MVDVERREAAGDQVRRRPVAGRRLVLLRRESHADRVRGDRSRGELRVRRLRVEEDLQLRLQELPHPVRALAGGDLVPVRPAHDREAEGELAPEGLELPLEVQVRALGGLRAQERAVPPGRADREGEHHVERPRGPELPLALRAPDRRA